MEELPQAPSEGGCVRPAWRQLHDLSHPRGRGEEAERIPDLRLERLRDRLHEVRAGEAQGVTRDTRRETRTETSSR